VDERLRELADNPGWALLVVKLVNLDRFRDAYGFVASDDVVRAVALMIQNAVRDLGSPSDFIGQLTPAQFILVISADTVSPVAARIRSRLEQSLDYFYPVKDRESGGIEGERLQVVIKQYQSDELPLEDLSAIKRYLVI
jgi:GGDEF domain-containing protein